MENDNASNGDARPELAAASGSAICDNCHEQCEGFKEDLTLICMSKEGDRAFRWGLNCSCGKRRWPNVEAWREDRRKPSTDTKNDK